MDVLMKDNIVIRYGHVLRKDMSDIVTRALDFRVRERSVCGGSMNTWLLAVVEQSGKAVMKESDAIDQSRWRLEFNVIYWYVR